MAAITCKRCEYTDDEDFFPVYISRTKYKLRHHVCLMCIQEEKDKHKRADRAVPKARNILYSHCEKYNRRNSTALKPMEFARKFGWDLKRITHDIEHAFNNWCSYCENPYHEMDHGLADVTLDIYDPSLPPYYNNVRYCCATCNKVKGDKPVAVWSKFLASVKRRREFLNSEYGTPGKPQHRMELNFDGSGKN